jgi:hypothetical protein
MINLRGEARSGLFSAVPDGGCVPAAFDIGGRTECCAGAGFFVTNGAGRGSWPRVGRVPARALLAVAKDWARTGGALTGFPGKAARTVGFTLG